MRVDLPDEWQHALAAVLASESFAALSRFVDEERRRAEVYPPEDDVFAALRLAPLSSIKVVILGQDPYHDSGQAHGLCFSVKPPQSPPPSLRNIFKERATDLGLPPPPTGDLTPWAQRGVLLLNTVLTVRAHEPASHTGKGWEAVTDAVIAAINARERPAVFCLWGAHAHKKRGRIDEARHVVVVGAHPSPLSATKFFGSRPFSSINAALLQRGQAPIDWTLAGESPQPTS
jgi:uracil-DNA glycosylase